MCLISNTMKAELEEIAGMARGASEREIETEVVHVLKKAGWPRSQINQDVPISDKGADKADIVLRLNSQPVILVEVKKHGHSRDADNQVNRYCRLLRPSPKLALLTDGVRWVLYYVGRVGATPIREASVPTETDAVVSMLDAFAPTSLSTLLSAGVFQYLDIVEQGLQERSEDTQKHLRPFFASTVKALLMPGGRSDETLSPTSAASQLQPASTEEQTSHIQADERSSALQDGDSLVECDPLRAPSLGFTTKITASFAGDAAKNWNDLLRVAVRTAFVSGRTKQDIQRMTSINIQEGSIEDKGYSPIEGTNLSVQGLNADEAWQNALKLAQSLGCAIEAKFHWKDNERASYPGKGGVLRWQP